MVRAWSCPHCRKPLTHYGAGHSEYDWQCDACGAAVAVDAEAGLARTRIWDKHAAKGVHAEFPLSQLQPEEGRP
jgi:hypothetical protein